MASDVDNDDDVAGDVVDNTWMMTWRDDIIDYVACDMSGTMTAHWLAGQFLNWASQLGHFLNHYQIKDHQKGP